MIRYAIAAGRFIQIVLRTTAFTFQTAFRLRSVPEEERDAYRAQRQMEGARLLCRVLDIEPVRCGPPVPSEPALIVSNHFGVLDPIVLAAVMPVAFAGKAELSRWPLVGWITRTMGVIFVHRTRRTRSAGFVRLIRERLDAGVSVLIFPEGTTTREPVTRPFKTGGFEAVREGGIVVPVFLQVTHIGGRPVDEDLRQRVVWAQSPHPFMHHFWTLLSLADVRMCVHVGEAITASRELDRKQLAARSHAAVESLRESASIRRGL